MSTTYPTDSGNSYTDKVDDVTTIEASDVNNLQDEVTALKTKVGIDASAVTSTIDYKLKNTASIDPGHKHTVTSVTLAVDDLSDAVITTPTDGQVLTYDSGSSTWKNAGSSGQPDASSTVEGITKLSVDPVTSTAPIAVGDNDPRIPTQDENDALAGTSGTAPSGTNKLVDAADVSSLGASGKIIRASGTALPALDAGNLTNVTPSFVAGVLSDLSTSSTGNNDITVTTTFTPRLIRLYYWLQGHTDASADVPQGAKGIAVYNGTTLLFNDVHWTDSNTANPIGNDSHLTFGAAPSATTAPTAGTGTSGTHAAAVTLSINSVSSTSFVVRRATVIGTGGSAQAKIAYEAFA